MDKRKEINRYYTAILYEEDPSYNAYLNNIFVNFEEVTYIDHNRDIDENGNIKKKHTHILFKVGENARHRRAIADIIGCKENMLEGCNKDKMLMYLIHLNNPEKTQYSVEEVHGELKQRLKDIIEKNIDVYIKYDRLIEAIKNEEINSEENLLEYCIKNKMLDILKNNQYILCNIIKKRSFSLRSANNNFVTKL